MGVGVRALGEALWERRCLVVNVINARERAYACHRVYVCVQGESNAKGTGHVRGQAAGGRELEVCGGGEG